MFDERRSQQANPFGFMGLDNGNSCFVACGLAALIVCLPALSSQVQRGQPNRAAVTFYEGVLPVFEQHCLSCHSPGGIGPMSLRTFEEARPWAAAIRESVKLRRMPPWFADPSHGEWANDPRLSDDQIRLIDEWAISGAPSGTPPKQRRGTAAASANPTSADLVIAAPRAVLVPANQAIDYQYLIFPLPFTHDRWVRSAEIRPSDRSVVHHAVLYVREPQSGWLRNVPPGVPYAPSEADALARARNTTADILAIYTPGMPAMVCPDGTAKKIPAGSDLVLQLHYTSKKIPGSDRPEIALAFASEPPKKRILTLQMGRDDLRIPPGEANYKASVSGTLPGEALLISMFPHMHLRGAGFDFDVVEPNGRVETLLKVRPYRFDWQLNYVLKRPRMLSKGTRLRWTGYFDNSPNNPYNPDPAAEVRWGEQSWEEMMIGFFDVAVEAGVDKQTFFAR
jgi:hypothetical protein